MPKTHGRFDHRRLAEALAERGIVDPAALQDALQQSLATGATLSQILVDESLCSDWEVSRAVCELFNLPFLTLEQYSPSEAAREGVEDEFLRRYLLVPLDRFEDIVTVAMPALVSTDVLTNLERLLNAEIIPVVSTVSSNRRWLNEHMPAGPTLEDIAAPLPNDLPDTPEAKDAVAAVAAAAASEEGWTDLFDEADAAVQLDLTGTEGGADGLDMLEGLPEEDV